MMDWTSESASSWCLEEQGVADSKVIVKAPKVSLGHEAVVTLWVPSEHEDSNVEEFPPEGFQSKLREANLELIRQRY